MGPSGSQSPDDHGLLAFILFFHLQDSCEIVVDQSALFRPEDIGSWSLSCNHHIVVCIGIEKIVPSQGTIKRVAPKEEMADGGCSKIMKGFLKHSFFDAVIVAILLGPGLLEESDPEVATFGVAEGNVVGDGGDSDIKVCGREFSIVENSNGVFFELLLRIFGY